MTNEPDQALPLPGIDPDPTNRAVTELERAVRRTLRAMDEAGLVQEVDAGKLQLAIEMAEVIAMKKNTRRASTIGNDARVLMEILNDFKESASEVDENLAATMAEWAEVIADADAHDPGHATAPVRDSS